MFAAIGQSFKIIDRRSRLLLTNLNNCQEDKAPPLPVAAAASTTDHHLSTTTTTTTTTTQLHRHLLLPTLPLPKKNPSSLLAYRLRIIIIIIIIMGLTKLLATILFLSLAAYYALNVCLSASPAREKMTGIDEDNYGLDYEKGSGGATPTAAASAGDILGTIRGTMFSGSSSRSNRTLDVEEQGDEVRSTQVKLDNIS